MDLPRYFADIAEELDRRSRAIRRDFATHRGSAGSNRESLLGDLLRDYLPGQFGLDTGLITSSDGQFSNQADLVVTDFIRNSPLHPSGPNRIWLVEAVHALIEVKTALPPSEIADAVNKCRRFKGLPRHFSDTPSRPKISDSLFILWAFESPTSETFKSNLVDAIRDVPIEERPDFVVVPGQLVATCGAYLELSMLGQPGSAHREQLEREKPEMFTTAFEPCRVYECGLDSLCAWLLWVLSWLNRAGPRSPDLLQYLPPEKHWGRLV